ncbi:hypothetical protein AVEN_231925-1 [Araneus ventricosus]|uniref:BACK domain-containing protein n=1 Tax=Araneus ventricosus TaxID=182803 RepID=A0A4Y2LQS3_ARAVE|nr:hypothetical protein AVEN_231925-1 [Araneus ventricosus]
MFASDFLLMDDLLKSCGSFAIQNMTSKNCLSFLSIAWQIDRLAILEDCFRFALVHFEDILKPSNGGFEELPFEILKTLLESNSLNVISERSVWKAIVSWTEANSSERLPHVPILLTSLRFEEVDKEEGRRRRPISKDELRAEIISHTIVSSNPHCSGLILLDPLHYYMTKNVTLSRQAKLEPHYQNLPGSYSLRVPSHLYITARRTLTPTKSGSELFLSYDNELDFWRQIGEAEFFIDTMVQIDQFIFLFSVQENKNLIFDIAEEEWMEISNPPGLCSNSCVITSGGQLFCVGGARNGHDSTNVIFNYNFEIDRWQHIRMLRPVIIYGSVTVGDLIFIVGVAEFDPVLICIAYDPEFDQWIVLPPPNVHRRGFSVVAFQEQVFV